MDDKDEEEQYKLWERPRKMIYFQASPEKDFNELYVENSKKKLGSGTYGDVFLAKLKSIDNYPKEVVLKRFGATLESNEATADVMRRELYIHGVATDKSTPLIAKCLKPPGSTADGCWVFEEDSTTFLVLQKYDADMKSWLKTAKLKTDTQVSLFRDIIGGLVNLGSLPGHDGISVPCIDDEVKAGLCAWIHLDIKPENVLMKDGHPFLHDFGLVEYVRTTLVPSGTYLSPVRRTDPDSTKLQKSAVTWGYRPPELICQSAAPGADTQEEFLDLCRDEVTELTKARDNNHLPYVGTNEPPAYIIHPHSATDVFSLGVLLLEVLGIQLYPDRQTNLELNNGVDFMFHPIMAEHEHHAVSEARIHYLLNRSGAKKLPSKRQQRLICLASLMMDSDATRRPSYPEIMAILDRVAKKKSFAIYGGWIATFVKSCRDAGSSWAGDQKKAKKKEPEHEKRGQLLPRKKKTYEMI
eukprot:gnl/Spiro4/2704_TR1307_c0_g1_i1.p1 gnl/Spiro4/2704_TR1307_c0_g1~~gnl/Spiro4/2704_TR1307_c0_g1_i1.p1  ORF type:complete len:538 (-),score=84.32 gnl/Spiro4/2704_TR1307_c0_g1_i1:74-1477(-)